jgi:ribosome-associated protein
VASARARGRKVPAADLLATIVAILDDNKAEDIVTIDLTGKSPMADHMVVATGRSQRQGQALADHVARAIKGQAPRLKIEGQTQGDWILIDAGDVVVHLFRQEVREFYKIEAMWGVATPEAPRNAFVA